MLELHLLVDSDLGENGVAPGRQQVAQGNLVNRK